MKEGNLMNNRLGGLLSLIWVDWNSTLLA